MKRPAVFFDRDNTLIVSDGYLGDASKVMLVEEAADAIAKARQYGFRVVVVSNQSGVARGMFSEDAVVAVNKRLDDLLQLANPSAVIEKHLYCPYHPDASIERYRQDSNLRKPKPGMLLQAAHELTLDLSRSWVIGDAPRDIEAGKAAGCRTILFCNPKLPPSPAATATANATPDFVVSSLKQAIETIAREAFRPSANASGQLAPTTAGQQTPADDDAAVQDTEYGDSADIPDADIADTVAAPAVGGDDQCTPPTDVAGEPLPTEESVTTMQDPTANATDLTTLENAQAAAMQPSLPLPDPPQSPRAGKSRRSALSTGGEKNQDGSMANVESLLEQILVELKRRRHDEVPDFSLSKLLAGIVQIVAVAALFMAYLNRDGANVQAILLTSIALETLTVALLIMGRQR